jgi:hypothetical protein
MKQHSPPVSTRLYNPRRASLQYPPSFSDPTANFYIPLPAHLISKIKPLNSEKKHSA